eukprot:scaffold82393_cov50-Prasinocladus_malaysianus.AAC.3
MELEVQRPLELMSEFVRILLPSAGICCSRHVVGTWPLSGQKKEGCIVLQIYFLLLTILMRRLVSHGASGSDGFDRLPDGVQGQQRPAPDHSAQRRARQLEERAADLAALRAMCLLRRPQGRAGPQVRPGRPPHAVQRPRHHLRVHHEGQVQAIQGTQRPAFENKVNPSIFSIIVSWATVAPF